MGSVVAAGNKVLRNVLLSSTEWLNTGNMDLKFQECSGNTADGWDVFI